MTPLLKINTEAIEEKFRSIDYSELNELFRSEIKKSLEILKSATESSLRATGINVDAPVHTKYGTYQPLIKGIYAEVSKDGTKGRVRIAKMGKNNNWPNDWGDDGFALKWFENGTDERKIKGSLIDVINPRSKHDRTVKRRLRAQSRGNIKSYSFFDKAYQSTVHQLNQELNNNVSRAIEQIFNK